MPSKYNKTKRIKEIKVDQSYFLKWKMQHIRTSIQYHRVEAGRVELREKILFSFQQFLMKHFFHFEINQYFRILVFISSYANKNRAGRNVI